MNCQMEELKRQLLASQQKVEELTKENGNLQQKVEELTKENEQQKQDFEGRIAQLQQEKEEIPTEFGKKLTEEEDQQIMRPMHEMKVQLPLENWFDLLALVPRRQLGKVAYQVGDRQFARILQLFLHDERREITLGRMEIISPRYNVPSDRPMLEGEGCYGSAAVDLPDWPMPKNVKSFDQLSLKYEDVDMHVLDFLQKFQENNLLANVKLDLDWEQRELMLPALDEIIPLICSIYSIHLCLDDWINDEIATEESQLLLKTMMAQTKILAITDNPLDSFDWCCPWLYTQRDDGMPRTLITEYHRFLRRTHCTSFIDRIKKDFLEAKHAVSFFIRLTVPKNFQREISLENNKTNEKLVVKTQAGKYDSQRLLISRHSSKAAKRKIEEEEKGILEWNQNTGPKRICLTFNEDREKLI